MGVPRWPHFAYETRSTERARYTLLSGRTKCGAQESPTLNCLHVPVLGDGRVSYVGQTRDPRGWACPQCSQPGGPRNSWTLMGGQCHCSAEQGPHSCGRAWWAEKGCPAGAGGSCHPARPPHPAEHEEPRVGCVPRCVLAWHLEEDGCVLRLREGGLGCTVAEIPLSLPTYRLARAASPCCPHRRRASRCRLRSRCPLPRNHPHSLASPAHSPTPMSGGLGGVWDRYLAQAMRHAGHHGSHVLRLPCSSGPAPSPSSFLPSPSPQPSQSPVTARTPQNFSVPSPGPLNTPGKLAQGVLGTARPCPQGLQVSLPLARPSLVPGVKALQPTEHQHPLHDTPCCLGPGRASHVTGAPIPHCVPLSEPQLSDEPRRLQPG